MKFRGIKKESEHRKFELLPVEGISSLFDVVKLQQYSKELSQSLKNYCLFQSHNHYRWPYWLTSSTDEFNRNFTPVFPLFLRNNSHSDYLQFSNFLSPCYLMIDPVGMVCSSRSCWSVEIWALLRDELLRPHNTPDTVFQKRDDATGIISTVWKHPSFTIQSELFGIRTTIDEAVLAVQCDLSSGSKQLSIVLAIRPYTLHSIGGVNSIEYKSSGKIIRINKSEGIHISMPPKEIFIGNSQIGDLDFFSSGEKIHCQTGMAEMAFLYPIKKTGFELYLRFSLSESKTVDPLNLNYENIKKDFLVYIDHMKDRGMQVSVPDKIFGKWFKITKQKALESLSKIIYEIKNNATSAEIEIWSRANIMVMALLRMGFEDEAKNIADVWLQTASLSKEHSFYEIIKYSFCISSFAEYFTISRDTEHLSRQMEKLKYVASSMLMYIQKNKFFKKLNHNKNSISGYFVPRFHFLDIIVIAHALSQYSYLCRTMGLFGEENIYSNESKKLKDLVVSHINDTLMKNNEHDSLKTIKLDEYAAYITLSNYPYYLDSIPSDLIAKYIQLLERFYKKYPIFIHSSGGWDIFLSLMTANNLLLLNNPSSLDIVNFILKVAQNRFALPAIMHPVTLRGISQVGDSDSVNSAVFLFLRNSLFFDRPDRLELFPVPREEWFKPKAEIEIINAPSRFGKINFKVVNTENEVQIFFSDLPKYIPPDILIRLPFPSDIKPADDFVLKKEFGNNFIINGWPSVLQFTRK